MQCIALDSNRKPNKSLSSLRAFNTTKRTIGLVPVHISFFSFSIVSFYHQWFFLSFHLSCIFNSLVKRLLGLLTTAIRACLFSKILIFIYFTSHFIHATLHFASFNCLVFHYGHLFVIGFVFFSVGSSTFLDQLLRVYIYFNANIFVKYSLGRRKKHIT